MPPSDQGLYAAVIERIFFAHHKAGLTSLEFDRSEILSAAAELNLDLAKNPGDVVYAFKFRRSLPERIQHTAPSGQEWRVTTAGRARYAFKLGVEFQVRPDPLLIETKIPDATPGIIARYALTDEQALLAKLRYNRLVDIFSGVTCYSLQNHLRTTVRVEQGSNETTQIETDEIYVGLDSNGAHYVFPVQAKGGKDTIAMQQIEQDILLCRQKFSGMVCAPLAAQFMTGGIIALFAFEPIGDEIRKTVERHYKLVPPDEIAEEDLRAYRKALGEK